MICSFVRYLFIIYHICSLLFLYLCITFYFILYICSLFFIFVCIWNCWSLHPARPAADCGWLLGQLFFGAQAFVPLVFFVFVWVILIIAVHISNVALKYKCTKTSGPLNSSFFAGGCYCTRGRRWHIAEEAKLQLVDIMQSIISEV